MDNNKGQQIMDKSKNEVSKRAQSAFQNATKFISSTSGVKQFAIGGVSGWCTGFLATKVGKTVAISVGGTVILVAAASQAGLVTIDWDKFGKQAEEMKTKVETKMPAIKTNVGKYARTNTMFAAGFVGGFLLGLAS